MTGIDRLIHAYNSSEPASASKDIYGWILQNLKTIGTCSIYKLAEETYSSTATISRLVRKLGYDNYRFFQKDIADNVVQYDFHNRILPTQIIVGEGQAGEALLLAASQLLDRMRDEMDMQSVDQLVEKLHEYDKIVLYLYEALGAKHFLQYDLFMEGKSCDAYNGESDILEHCSQLDPETFVIVMAAYNLKQNDVDKALRAIKRAGSQVCFVTDSRHYAAQINADMKIVLPGIHSILDMLFEEFFLHLVTVKYRQKYID